MYKSKLTEENIDAIFNILYKQIQINKELLEFCKQLTTGVEIGYLVKAAELIEKQENEKVYIK